MPGITSMDNLIASIANGQFYRADWNKNFLPTTAAAAGEWFNLARGGGNPPADALYNTGTNLTWQQLLDSTASAGNILHGGNVSPAYKSLLNASGFSAAATTMPAVLMLVDLLGFYRLTTTTTTGDQAAVNTLVNNGNWTTDGASNVLTHTFINLKTFSRVQVSNSGGALPTGLAAATDYWTIKLSDTTCKLATTRANAVAGTFITISSAGTGTQSFMGTLARYTDGAGVQAFMYANNATPLGAGTPNLRLTYQNSVGVAGQLTPATLPVGKTAANNGVILYSGTGVGKYGPFMPLVSGDAGCERITQINLSATYTSGELSVVQCHPLLTLPMTTIGVAGERDLLNQVPSLPRIYDGACLMWLIYNGALTPVNSAFYGHLDFAWN